MERFFEFTINHWDLFLALFIILAMMVGGPILRRIRGYHEVDTNGAVQLMNHQDAVVLDVREESELKDGMILNSIHIPLGSVESRINEIADYKDRTVLVNCRSGHRSNSACVKLRKHGFANVYNLKGGIMAWKSANLPIEMAGKKKKKRK